MTDLATVLTQLTTLLSQQDGVIGANNDFIAGTIDDPQSFNSAGGKTGALGYYPMTDAGGQTAFFPCLKRLQALVVAGADPALVEGLLSSGVSAAIEQRELAQQARDAAAGYAGTSAAAAGTATTKASEAGGARDTAVSAAGTATAKADISVAKAAEATAGAGTATIKAGEAAASRDTAVGAAGTATDKAAVATQALTDTVANAAIALAQRLLAEAAAAQAASTLAGVSGPLGSDWQSIKVTAREGAYPFMDGGGAASTGAIRSSGVGMSRAGRAIGIGLDVTTAGLMTFAVGSLANGTFGDEHVFTLTPTATGKQEIIFADVGVAAFPFLASMALCWRSTSGGGLVRLVAAAGLTSTSMLVQGTPVPLSAASSSRPSIYLIYEYDTYPLIKAAIDANAAAIAATSPAALAMPGGPASATINPQGQLVPGNDALGPWATIVPMDDGTPYDRQRFNDAVTFLRNAITPKDGACGFKNGYGNGTAGTVRQPVACWINDDLYFACWEARDGTGGDSDPSTAEAAWCVKGVWQPQFVLMSDTSQQMDGTTKKNCCSNLSVAYDEGLNELRVGGRFRRRDYAQSGTVANLTTTADGTPFFSLVEAVTANPGPAAIWTGNAGAVLTLPASRAQLVSADYLKPPASQDLEQYVCWPNSHGVYKKIGAMAGTLWMPFRTRYQNDTDHVAIRLGRFDRPTGKWVLGGYSLMYLTGTIGPGECTIEETPEGKWLVISRTNSGGNRLCYIVSADGATCEQVWYDTIDLYGQEMTGSLLRLSGPPAFDGQPYRLLFVANLNTDGASSASRGGMGVRICYGFDATTGRPVWSKRVNKLFPYSPTIVFQSLSGVAIPLGSPVTNFNSATCICRTGPLSFAVACDKETYAIGSSGMFNAVGWIDLNLGSLFLRGDAAPGGDIPATDNTATLATVRSSVAFRSPLAMPAVWDSANYPRSAKRGIALAGSVGYTALAAASIAALNHAGRFSEEQMSGDTLLLTPESVTMAADGTSAERLFSIAPRPCLILPQNTARVPITTVAGVPMFNWDGGPTATWYRGYLPRDFCGDPSGVSAFSMYGTVLFTANTGAAFQTIFRLMNGSDVFLSMGRDQSASGSFWRVNISKTPASTSKQLYGTTGGGECATGVHYWWYLEIDRATDTVTLWAGTAGQTIGDATKRITGSAVFGDAAALAWGVDCAIQYGGKATSGTIKTSCQTRTLGMRPGSRTLAQKQDRIARMLLANPQIV